MMLYEVVCRGQNGNSNCTEITLVAGLLDEVDKWHGTE